ncbi:MAG: lipo-like protein [Sphingomonadales bacterium]|nr:lipo-like protein [Sphingomonadales bacterium]
MGWATEKIGRSLARYLSRPNRHYEPFSITDHWDLLEHLEPGDVLLVEGNQRISTAIKYLTQSTWSHSAIFVGDILPVAAEEDEPKPLIEALLRDGVVASPLSKYAHFNTRICRPVGLGQAERAEVVAFMVASLGMTYDVKNIVDLMRYLLPTPPVPTQLRRRMLALGSGDPTRAICSSLIARAFQSVRYPILPHVESQPVFDPVTSAYTVQEIHHIRHHSLFTPRDFDLSPYFEVVKPTLQRGFDHRAMLWGDGRDAA